jgi:predicted SprT family Zn-dependent metalloprotease
MQSKIQAVRNKVNECINDAERTFGITMPKVDVRFDLTGRAAGVAGMRYGVFYLRFNVNHMSLGGQTWEHLLNDTVPHEVAHTVCQAFPKFGRSHNDGWKRVCLALGGNGRRCYSAEDAPEAVAKQRPFTYTSTSGAAVAVSPIIHRKIQNGASYRYRGMGIVSKMCSYSTTTAQSVVKKVAAPTVPAVAKVAVERHVPAGGMSNASLIRAYLAKAKADFGSEAEEKTVQFAIGALGMKAALARTYVRNNWTKC